MKRKNSGYVMTTMLLDPQVREEFEKLLPRDKTLADAIREYMQAVVDEQKKGEGSGESLPILSVLPRQTTINEYDSFMTYGEEKLNDLDNRHLEQFRAKCVRMSIAAVQLKKKRKNP